MTSLPNLKLPYFFPSVWGLLTSKKPKGAVQYTARKVRHNMKLGTEHPTSKEKEILHPKETQIKIPASGAQAVS